MKKTLVFASLSFGLFAAPLFIAAPAHATGLASCGNIDVEANAMCDVKTTGGCAANCTPVSVQATCAAQLDAQCDGQCTGSASATCTGSCDVSSCEAECTAMGPSFDCSAHCQADAQADCDANCASSADSTHCQASCKANATAKCDASCKGTPPSATCMAQCNASCSGSCTAQSTLNCQVNCQSSLQANCETMVQGGCNVQCSKPEGALFCNGNYVDTNGNLASCEAAIAALFPTIHVTTNGMASANCSGNTCEAQASGSAKASCAVAPGRSNQGMGGAAALLVGLGAMLVGRRRQAR
ncbi:MAG TPA: hypothetical protein VGI10_23575 [Polyangiaceae bacterium]|jgi:hypothetical protein